MKKKTFAFVLAITIVASITTGYFADSTAIKDAAERGTIPYSIIFSVMK